MKTIIISLAVIFLSLESMPFHFFIYSCRLFPKQLHTARRYCSNLVVKNILSEVKPEHYDTFKQYLQYEHAIHQLRTTPENSALKVLDELQKRKISFEDQLQKDPELNKPYQQFTQVIQSHFNNLVQNMVNPLKKRRQLMRNDLFNDNDNDIKEKETLHHLAQEINDNMEHFKDKCVDLCLQELSAKTS